MSPLDVARFWSGVDVRRPGQCWLWKRCTKPNGYGQTKVGGKTRSSHSVAFELTKGPPPKGMVVRHSCHERLCCNPDHLSVGTVADNMEDMVKAGRQAYPNPGAKLSEDEVKEILRLYESGDGPSLLAKKFSVSRYAIYRITRGKAWGRARKKPAGPGFAVGWYKALTGAWHATRADDDSPHSLCGLAACTSGRRLIPRPDGSVCLRCAAKEDKARGAV